MLDIAPAETEKLQARIVVIGAGGAGCNAINNMIDKKLPGVQFVSMNTDTQSLGHSMAPTKLQLGQDATQGLGAGANPDVGRAAAMESESKIQAVLKGAHMVFITAGMGGGTGTGAAPVIARLSKEMDILTVGVVTKPFKFERRRRADIAESGIRELQQFVDTLIVIPNENLFRLNDGPTTLNDAFAHADDVLLSGVRGVTDLIVQEGKINLDFNDIKTVMKEMGKAVMGTGEAAGENRAREAALQAINNPLLEDISLHGASSVLINITSGTDVTLDETNEAVNTITEDTSEDALVIFGLTINEELGDSIRISMIATGVETGDSTSQKAATPKSVSTLAATSITASAGSQMVAPQPQVAPSLSEPPVSAPVSGVVPDKAAASGAYPAVSASMGETPASTEPEGLFAQGDASSVKMSAASVPSAPPVQSSFIPPMPTAAVPSEASPFVPGSVDNAHQNNSPLSVLRQQAQPDADPVGDASKSNIPRFLRRPNA